MEKRFGFWLAFINLLGGLLYFGLVSVAAIVGGLPPVEPYQTLISIVTFLSIPGLIFLWVVLHRQISPSKQLFSQTSLVLMIVFATLTSINRYTSLTVVPQAQALGQTQGLNWFQPYGWPSIMAAMEVLAWGFYFGLACLCLAPAFLSDKLEKPIFWVLLGCGILSLLAVLGQVLNNVPLNLLGILAWGPGFTILMLLLMAWFKRAPSH
jgi:hypothetical protein